MQDKAPSHTRSAADATPWWSTTGGRGLVLVTATLLLVASLAAVGYLLAPSAVERALIRTAAEATGSALSIGQVRVEPFRLGVVLNDVRLADAHSDELLTVERVEYRLRVRSLLGARRVLDRLALQRPQMTLAVARQPGAAPGQSMPMQMLSALIDAESFQVEQLSITDGEIHLRGIGESGEHVRVLSGIALSLGSVDSGGAAAPAPYHLEIEQAYGARLILEGEVRLRSATAGPPMVQVLPSRGELSGFRLSVLPGVLLVAPVVEIDAFVGTLGLPGASPEAAARVHIATASLREGDGAELALSQLDGAFELERSGHGGAELQLQGRSEIGAHFELSRRYLTGDASPAVALTLKDVGGNALSRMLAAAVGRHIDAGLATIALLADSNEHGRLSQGVLEVVASNLDFANEMLTPHELDELDQGHEPFSDLSDRRVDAALLLALLEDTHGEVRLEVPVELTAAIPVTAALTQAFRAFVHESVASPAVALGRSLALPGPPPMVVRFEPGAAALTQAASAALSELAEALSLRPRLTVAVPAHIDPQLDRDALARQQIELHVTLATAGAAFRARPQAVNFASPRAQDVLDEFAVERLPARELAAIGAQHDRTGEPAARAPYYRAVFAALVEGEPIERGALERIGRFRAQSIVEALVAGGLAAERVALVESSDTQAGRHQEEAGVVVDLQLRRR